MSNLRKDRQGSVWDRYFRSTHDIWQIHCIKAHQDTVSGRKEALFSFSSHFIRDLYRYLISTARDCDSVNRSSFQQK